MWFKIAKNPITKKKSITDKIIHYCLFAVVLLLPVMFFPYSDTILEFPKLFMLGILVVIAAIAWVLGAVKNKRAIFKQGLLNKLVLVFGAIYILSWIFSVDHFTSLVGNGLSHGSVVSVLIGMALYFLIVNSVQDTKEFWALVRAFLFSGLLVLIFNLAQLFDVHIIPFAFAQNNAFNLVANSVSIFAIYIVVLFTLAFGFLIKSERKIDRILSEVVILLSFAVLFFLDSSIGWYLLIGGMFFWLVFLSMQSKKIRTAWIIIPTVFVVIAVGFLFFDTSSISAVIPPQDVKLDMQTAWDVTRSGGIRSMLFGSGPETYLYNFTKYRPTEFNDTLLWQLRFDRSYNELFQLATTVGFWGMILFAALFIFPIIKIGRKIFSAKQPDDSWFYFSTVIAGFVVILLSVFLHHFSVMTFLIFWILLGFCGSIISKKEKKIDFIKSPQGNFSFSIGFAVLLIASVSFAYFGIRIFAGEYYYTKAEIIAADDPKSETVGQYLEKSVNQSPWNAQYRISLAEQNIVASSLDQNSLVTAQYLAEAKSGLDEAIKHSNNNAIIIEKAAEAYRLINNLNGPVSVTEVFDTYSQAIESDPNNAYLIFNVANVYYASAQSLGQSESITAEIEEEINNLLSSAEQNALYAVGIRKNFWEAELILAKTYKMQKRIQESVDLLTDTVNLNPYNLSVREELGTGLIEQNDLDKAKEQFEIMIAIQPDHANAHFWLAVVYEAQGEKEKAISELEKVLETNPENEMIMQKIDGLKAE